MTIRHEPAVRYRRSDHIVVYWSHGGPRAYNYASGRRLSVAASTIPVLDGYSTWRTVHEVARRLPAVDRHRVQQLTERLHAGGLLLRHDEGDDPLERRMSALGPWNPSAGFFHRASRDVRFAPLAEMRATQRGRAADSPWPGAIVDIRGARVTDLPAPARATALSRAFLDRRSWRQFGPGRVRLRDVATLLWLTGGIQHWVESDFGTFALKTSPSGGSLHPVELYLLARNVEGLAAGIYHYSSSGHALAELERHPSTVPIRKYLPQQPWFEGAAAAVFFVAHHDRALWRYTYPRAYRAPFVEAGHLAQTFCVKATELGLAPFVSMALADAEIERAIGADGVTRAVLYAAGVGLRPTGIAWAPSPEGLPTATRRVNRPRPARAGPRRDR